MVHDTVFKSWFVEDFTADGAKTACVVNDYELVDEAGELLVSDLAKMSPHYNDFIH